MSWFYIDILLHTNSLLPQATILSPFIVSGAHSIISSVNNITFYRKFDSPSRTHEWVAPTVSMLALLLLQLLLLLAASAGTAAAALSLPHNFIKLGSSLYFI